MDELKGLLRLLILGQLFLLFLLILQPVLQHWLYHVSGKVFFGIVVVAAAAFAVALRRHLRQL